MKKSFLLYCDLKHTIDKLPDETAGRLLKLILDYANGDFNEPTDLLLQVVFEPIKQSLIRDLEKYDAKVIRNRENGSKGGRPSKEDNPQKPTGLINNPLKAKKADSDSDSDNDSVSDNDNDNDNDIIKIAKATSFKSYSNKDLINQIKPLIDKFGKDTCNAFYSYWSEPLANGKMRLTNEKAWDTNRRLTSWKQREKQPTNTFVKQPQPVFNRSSQGQHYVGDDVK
jgi:hypothetical protein